MKSLTQICEATIQTWLMLSRGAKRLFKFLQYLAKKQKFVFPSIETIMERSLLGKSQVHRILKKFEQLGWLGRINRPYQSNLYFIRDDLIAVDFDSKEYLKKPSTSQENGTQNGTVLGSYSEKSIFSSTSETVPAQKARLKRPILHRIAKILGLSDQQKQQLCDNFSEYALNQACEDVNWYRKQGNKIKNLGGFLWNRALCAAKKLM